MREALTYIITSALTVYFIVALVSSFTNANTVFNVRSYGAVGDGIHDDTQAVQEAITAARAYSEEKNKIVTVYFPQGTYKIKVWNNYPNMTLKGDNSKIIRYFSNKIEIPISNLSIIDFADIVQISDLRGVNVGVKNVVMDQRSGVKYNNQPPIDDVLQEIKGMNMNMIRTHFSFEGYYYNKTKFIQGLHNLADAADRNGVAVLYDPLHQWFLSSYLSLIHPITGQTTYGIGFPHECIQALGIPYGADAQTPLPELGNKTAIQVFWANFTRNYNCTLDGVNKPIWEHYKDFFNILINITKDHPSTLGYELLNEPFVKYIFTMEDFEGLKSFYKEIAIHIRSQTEKKIFYDAIYGHTADWRYGQYSNREEAVGSLAPRYPNGQLISNLVFLHTFYDAPLSENWASWHVTWLNGYKQYIESLGIPIFTGEWNVDKNLYADNTPINITEAISYMQYWKNSKWGWTYWTYDPLAYGIKDANYNDVINPRENRTQKQILIDAINQVY